MNTILVCDDDREIVEAIAIYLEKDGYQVRKAYDGDEAVKIIEREEIDLLIIDVMMPKLGGVEATFRIREKAAYRLLFCRQSRKIRIKYLGLGWGRMIM